MKMKTIQESRQLIIEASKEGWHVLREALEQNANREIVEVEFEVIYDELGHDMILQARVNAVAPETYFLQTWLQDIHSGIWIPEYHPWVAGVVEYSASQKITSALCGLFDSKWRREDSGEKYEALAWGYVEHQGAVTQFGPFVKEFVYPVAGNGSG